MSVFKDYAKYYNLLYKDKNYKKEVDFVHDLIQKYHPTTRSILEVGCGTGHHASLLAGKGYDVTGVDSSEAMLSIAKSSWDSIHLDSLKIRFLQGDIRNLQLNGQFDAILSFFHVMSYQSKSEDFEAVVNTAAKHLQTEGLFIFDFWYGPAVLTERPSVRVKHMKNDEMNIKRIAEPVMHPNDNIVDVNYTAVVQNNKNGKTEEVKETHRMRYWFMPEIIFFLSRAQFQLCEMGEWLTSKKPGFDTWSVYCIAKKI